MAFLGPDTPALGERKAVVPVTESQVAATLAALLGEDYLEDFLVNPESHGASTRRTTRTFDSRNRSPRGRQYSAVRPTRFEFQHVLIPVSYTHLGNCNTGESERC